MTEEDTNTSSQAVPTPDKSTVTDAVLDTSSAEECPDKEAGEKREGGKLKGGFDAREAARLRWEKDRARKANSQLEAAHQARGQVVVVRTPVQVGTIIQKLADKAQKGDVATARELRAYLAEFPVEAETDVSALDKRTRQAMLAALMDDRLVEIIAAGDLPLMLEHWLADHPYDDVDEQAGTSTVT